MAGEDGLLPPRIVRSNVGQPNSLQVFKSGEKSNFLVIRHVILGHSELTFSFLRNSINLQVLRGHKIKKKKKNVMRTERRRIEKAADIRLVASNGMDWQRRPPCARTPFRPHPGGNANQYKLNK